MTDISCGTQIYKSANLEDTSVLAQQVSIQLHIRNGTDVFSRDGIDARDRNILPAHTSYVSDNYMHVYAYLHYSQSATCARSDCGKPRMHRGRLVLSIRRCRREWHWRKTVVSYSLLVLGDS